MRTFDQNQFPKHDLIAATTDGILIPDITWFENIKSPGWRLDVSRSFEAFHKAPEKIHIGHATGALLHQELNSKRPTTDPVNWEGTTLLRDLLRQKDYISLIESNVDSLRSAGLQPLINLPDNRLSLEEGLAALTGILGEKGMAAFRAAHRTTNTSLRDYAPSIAAIAEKSLSDTFTDLGLSQADSASLTNRQSAFFRTKFCFWAQIFRYAMNSTSLQLGDRKLLNDLVDSDYAIIASYTDALESDDAGLRERYDALVAAVTQPQI
jgi:hypothetical protein